MPRREPALARRSRPVVERVLEPPEASILDLLDRLLDKGVVADGDVALGVAGVDLIYVRLAALLCAADRVLPRGAPVPKRPSRHRPDFARRRLRLLKGRGGGQPRSRQRL